MTTQWQKDLRAGACYTEDKCVMDATCPFYGNCTTVDRSAEPYPEYLVPHEPPKRYTFAESERLSGLERLQEAMEIIEMPYHHCLMCWLVGKLPGHYRCSHGYISCPDCSIGLYAR
jgi:hypothetical protein